MSIITHEAFWNLVAKLPKMKPKAELRNDYFSCPKWTKTIESFFYSITDDIKELSDALYDNVILEQEVTRNIIGMSRIDFVYCKNNSDENKEIIFIEHENHPNPHVFNELDKLYKIKSNELKVLIWYYNAVPLDVNNNLDSQIIKITNFFMDLPDENFENWLIILGPATIGNYGKKNFYSLMQNKDYSAYIIDKKDNQISLKELESKQIISSFINANK